MFSHRKSSRPAFTLIEMMVVIVIILLAMGLAIPAIRSLTGSRSQEAAQNVLTTALGAARARAMAMQRVTGILFYLDEGTDRVNCVMVEEVAPQVTDPPPTSLVHFFDAVADTDPIALPAGLRVFTMKDSMPYFPPGSPTNYVEYFSGRYMGYNYPGGGTPVSNDPTVANPLGGCILFDASGRLTVENYGFRFMYPATPPPPATSTTPAHISQLGSICYGANNPLPPDWPKGPRTPYIASAIGLVIVDRETFLNHTSVSGTPYSDWNNPAIQGEADNWLDTNGTPIFVNRYDATLMRAE